MSMGREVLRPAEEEAGSRTEDLPRLIHDGVDDDRSKEMLISIVLVAEWTVARQPLLQRLQTVFFSVVSGVVDVHVDILAIGGTFLLDGSSDQGLDVGDVGAQSDQRDDDAVTFLGAVL
jgi:hypothetical protein